MPTPIATRVFDGHKYVAIIGPMTESKEDKDIMGRAIKLFRDKGTKYHVELRKIGRRRELWLWRDAATYKFGNDLTDKRSAVKTRHNSKPVTTHRK